jgi:hypothetical protein
MTRRGEADESGAEAFPDMSEEEFETFLAEAVEAYADECEAPRPRVRTFADAGVLTMNRGLVVRIGAAEFQVQVVRSR